MTDFTPVGKKLILSIDGAKVKNDVALQFEFPEEVANLYREFITVYRPRLECPSSRYLFAGIDGRPRYHSSVRQNLKESVFRITGLNVFPHLARHFRSKMIMDHNAELALAVSMSLGHKNPSTTYAYYMGSEQKAAARRMDEVLDKLKSATGQGRKRRRP
jgi:integrase